MHPSEILGGKIWNARELERLLFGKSVADLNRAMVNDTDDISGPGLLDNGPVLGHEDDRVGNKYVFADAMMANPHSPLKTA